MRQCKFNNKMSNKEEQADVKIQIKVKSSDPQWENIKDVFKKWRESTPTPSGEDAKAKEAGIQLQLKSSDKCLSELLRDGIELITNVKIANDKREVERRDDETQIRANLIKALDKESGEASKKLDVIKYRWNELDTLKEPMGLYDGLQYQRQRIAELMQQKDGVIVELHDAIVKSDERYQMDQQKQSADIFCLVERIDLQVDVMKRAYRDHLKSLQNTIDDEKRLIMNTNSKKWQKLYDKRNDNEKNTLKEHFNQVDFHESEIYRIMLEHEELTRSTKIKLESDNATLQIELENVKAEVMLNSEKLSYNYRILQKRADENIIIRNQQKRRLCKLQEAIHLLKEKSRNAKQRGENEIAKCGTEIQKLNTTINEMYMKSDLFVVQNDEKYHSVWQINENEAKQMLKKILSIDKIIHAQQLGLEWDPPINTDNTVFNKNIRFKTVLLPPSPSVLSENSSKLSATYTKQELSTMKNLIEKISSALTWLLDEKLDFLLEPYHKLEKTLVKIDNIFALLNITTMNDVRVLKEYFIPYTHCLDCSKIIKDNHEMDLKPLSETCFNHCLIIKTSLVLPTLRKFVEDRKKVRTAEQTKKKNDESTLRSSRLLKTEDVEQFWTSISEAIPQHNFRLWKSLENGLGEYVTVLKKREKLDNECEYLRQQNAELKHLLQRYLPFNEQTKNSL